MKALDHRLVASTCSLVCKSWLRVSRDNFLWRSLLARDFHKNETVRDNSSYASLERVLRKAAADGEMNWLSGNSRNGILNRTFL